MILPAILNGKHKPVSLDQNGTPEKQIAHRERGSTNNQT